MHSISKQKIGRTDLILYLHGASAFQILHAGVELRIFELLNNVGSASLEGIVNYIGLMHQTIRTLVFGLTSLGILEKFGEEYKNCDAIEELFNNNEYSLFRKMTLIQAHIMYLGQADYVESLKQNKNVGVERYSGAGKTIYERLKKDSKLRKIFYDYMEAYSAYALPYLLKEIDLSNAKKILDVGGGYASNAIKIAKKYSDSNITLIDISTAKTGALKNIKRNKIEDRVKFYEGCIFKDEFPNNQDCVMFIHQLVIWSLDDNKLLIKKAYNSLNKGGKVVIFSSMSDDDEKGPLMAGLDTVYFRAVAAGKGMIYPYSEYEKILKDVGFDKIKIIKCNTWTPHKIVIGVK
jgi:L-tyrosine C(3)-methyltransferase